MFLFPIVTLNSIKLACLIKDFQFYRCLIHKYDQGLQSNFKSNVEPLELKQKDNLWTFLLFFSDGNIYF